LLRRSRAARFKKDLRKNPLWHLAYKAGSNASVPQKYHRQYHGSTNGRFRLTEELEQEVAGIGL